jgi:hypothetical protein
MRNNRFVWTVAGSSPVVTPQGARHAAVSLCERSCYRPPQRGRSSKLTDV